MFMFYVYVLLTTKKKITDWNVYFDVVSCKIQRTHKKNPNYRGKVIADSKNTWLGKLSRTGED